MFMITVVFSMDLLIQGVCITNIISFSWLFLDSFATKLFTYCWCKAINCSQFPRNGKKRTICYSPLFDWKQEYRSFSKLGCMKRKNVGRYCLLGSNLEYESFWMYIDVLIFIRIYAGRSHIVSRTALRYGTKSIKSSLATDKMNN